jgi:hypothetical protein
MMNKPPDIPDIRHQAEPGHSGHFPFRGNVGCQGEVPGHFCGGGNTNREPAHG